jgi:hypothetical protein
LVGGLMSDGPTLLDLIKARGKEDLVEAITAMPRSDLLPHLFQIRGRPYRLDDYPQCKTFYPKEYPRDMLWLCGRQVAKSTNLSRSEVLDLVQIPHFQCLYVAPLQSQAQRYSQLYLKEAISTCKPAVTLQGGDDFLQTSGNNAAVVRSVGHQSFANGAGIQLTYAKTSPDRARGITADRVDFDEIQDQLINHLPVISESLSNSDWGHRRFTGTAKTTDNIIEYLWRQSSMSEWHMHCECGRWNVPTREGGVLDMITAQGPVCVKCRRPLDIRHGEMVHAVPDVADEFLGFHIPQIIVPAIVYNPNKWGQLINKVTKLPPGVIYTEILGISSDEGVRLISKDDILAASNLGRHENLLRAVDNYAYIVVGVDWGIAEITSFTVATVVGITHQGIINVLYAKRYVATDMETIIADIVRMSRAYHATYIAADFGVGFTNNQMLAKRTQRVVQIQYVEQNKFLSFKELAGVPRWTVDRNTALTLLYWNIKNHRIFFPNPEDSEAYTRDLLSPYELLTEQSSGITKKKFVRDPAKPDDFAHALCFATLVLYRLIGHDALSIVPEEMIGSSSSFKPSESIDVDDLIAAQRSF